MKKADKTPIDIDNLLLPIHHRGNKKDSPDKEEQELFAIKVPYKDINFAFRLLFWFFLLLFVAIVIVKFWHLLTPDDWNFLTSEKISKVDAILFSSVTSAALTKLSGSILQRKL